MAIEVTWELVWRWVWTSSLVFGLVLGVALAWLLEQMRLGILLLYGLLLIFVVLARAMPGTLSAVGLTILFGILVYVAGRALLANRRFGDIYHVAKEVVPAYIVEKRILSKIRTQNPRIEKFKGYRLIEYPLDGLVVAWDNETGVEAHQFMSMEQFKKVWQPEGGKKSEPVISGEQGVDAGEEVETED